MAKNKKLNSNAKEILALADRHYNAIVDAINAGDWEDNQLLHLLVEALALDAANLGTRQVLRILKKET